MKKSKLNKKRLILLLIELTCVDAMTFSYVFLIVRIVSFKSNLMEIILWLIWMLYGVLIIGLSREIIENDILERKRLISPTTL